uniref:Uncharacterized protein n=1 Tax=Knipowitschia caucasica TaxID=637954 RepID=A0AAV2KAF6_KNICA
MTSYSSSSARRPAPPPRLVRPEASHDTPPGNSGHPSSRPGYGQDSLITSTTYGQKMASLSNCLSRSAIPGSPSADIHLMMHYADQEAAAGLESCTGPGGFRGESVVTGAELTTD